MKGLVLGCLLILLGGFAWAKNDSMSEAGHDGPQSGGGDNCPQGTSYVSAGDGCANAQPASNVQHQNFFTGYIPGTNYVTRPPWNVAGVDYAVGYDGAALKDPTVAGNRPACMTVYNSSTFQINGDAQPCVIDHFDFTLHGGTCVLVTGATGQTVTFTNNNWGAPSTSGCTLSTLYIYEAPGSQTNITFKFNTVTDNYGCNCPNIIYINTQKPVNVVIEYNAFYELSARVINANNGSTSFMYNMVDGIGENTAGIHGEVDEYGGTGTETVTHLFNTYYLHPNDADTGIIYITTGTATAGGTISVNAQYNTLIARQRTSDGHNPTVAPVWLQTNGNVVIPSATVSNNYEDNNGWTYSPAFVYPPDSGTGYIGSGSICTGNKSLNTGRPIRGGLGRGTSTLVCR
jgi:hypothetical protein